MKKEESVWIEQWSLTGGDFAPREYVAISGDILGCHDLGVLLASNR